MVRRPVLPSDQARKVRFGQHIHKLREERGLTQDELAHAAALEPSYIKRIEKGTARPGWSQLHALADGLGVDIKELWP